MLLVASVLPVFLFICVWSTFCLFCLLCAVFMHGFRFCFLPVFFCLHFARFRLVKKKRKTKTTKQHWQILTYSSAKEPLDQINKGFNLRDANRWSVEFPGHHECSRDDCKGQHHTNTFGDGGFGLPPRIRKMRTACGSVLPKNPVLLGTFFQCRHNNPVLGAGGGFTWYHFGVGAPPILVDFSGNWDVHWGYGLLTHGHIDCMCPFVATAAFYRRNRFGFDSGRCHWAATRCCASSRRTRSWRRRTDRFLFVVV